MTKENRRTSLLTWDQTLPWQRDNAYILTAYRQASASYQSSVRSILYIHNETVNIWSHLIASILFMILLWQDGTRTFPGITQTWPSSDRMMVGMYYLCVITCFTLSATFHIFSDHSAHMHKFGNKLDHLGIVLVMWGSGITANHFVFHGKADSTLRNAYFTVLTTVGIGCAIFTLQPKFREPLFRPFRVVMYAMQGIGLFLPCIHSLYRYGWDITERNTHLTSFISLACIQFSGALIYAARIPERWFPVRFDIVGQSHNWMHCLVVYGAIVRLRGLHEANEFWNSGSQPG